jgi:CPA1 family monovalent cation:H+ antiporter
MNDGTAAVLFGLGLAFFQSHNVQVGSGVLSFFTITIGGSLCGMFFGGIALLIAGRSYDHLVECTVSLVAAFMSFWVGDHFHLSGILATMSAGIMIGNLGSMRIITAKGRESVEIVWEIAAFIANSIIFILIGLHLAHDNFVILWLPILIAIVIVLLGRVLSVYPCCALFSKSKIKVEINHQHILVWGGLRGAIALALSLSLPPDFPGRDMIITTTLAVVAFSVIVQGLTMKPLMTKLWIKKG